MGIVIQNKIGEWFSTENENKYGYRKRFIKPIVVVFKHPI